MSSRISTSRDCSHAGSWYSESPEELSEELTQWLATAKEENNNSNSSNGSDALVRAVISPHAGYSYSGSTAAHSYRHLEPSTIKRIFILGPSHHYYTKYCELPATEKYKTPVGNLTLDRAILDALQASGLFKTMSNSADEAEHSIEMQLPFIAHILARSEKAIPIVPVLVGSLSTDAEARYGQFFSSYLDDPGNFFVISSDFCHWGQRFDYTYYDKKDGEIYQSIEKLDKLGMENITSLQPKAFASYEKQYKNTICGRHPIAVLMHAVAHSKLSQDKWKMQFVKYKQSSQCKKMSDSSVSYAAGVLTQQQ
jgi:AmmeMemoRadiSam system protein B